MIRSQFKKEAKDASAFVIVRFYQYRKLALLQQTWFANNGSASAAGRSRGRRGAMAINMTELNACRVSYKKSLANLKSIMQARSRPHKHLELVLSFLYGMQIVVVYLNTRMAQRNSQVLQEMAEGRQLDVSLAPF